MDHGIVLVTGDLILFQRVLETGVDTEEPQQNETDPPVDTEPIADCDSSGEEPEHQDTNYTYASMEESTTESECDDDPEELSSADVRWENSKSYLNIVYNSWKHS